MCNIPASTVICNNCGWIGDEDDLVLIKEVNGQVVSYETSTSVVTLDRNQPKDAPVEFYKGCEKCLTDGYLMDIEL